MSLGGAGAPGITYRNLINADLSGFVAKIVQYAVDNNLDGIDVDIEGDVLNGTTLTSVQYENFITSLEVGLHAQNKLMTAALATWFATRVTNIAASKFDFINLMSYDAYGTWTGPGQHAPYSFAVSDLTYWQVTKGIPAAKLTVGVPFYGYYWGSSSSSYTFADIQINYPGTQNQDQKIPTTGGVLYYNGIPTIKQKTVLAIEQAGGIMIWQLVGDATGANSLLLAIDEVVVGHAANISPTVSISAPLASTVYTEGDTVQLEINTADSDGTIMRVEYYAGTFKIGEVFAAPYTMKWVGAGPGSYSLTAVVMDNIGKTVTSSAVAITVNAATLSSPFSGTPISIPGKVEVENFNLGGNNIGYYDLTSTNLGGFYRTGRVDIEECLDNGGTYDVGWTDAGEWLEYSVNITTSGKYDFQSRVANGSTSGTFHIEIDGIDVTGVIAVNTTNGWQKWQTVTTSNIQLYQGLRKMKIVMNTGGFNMNYVSVLPTIISSVSKTELTKNNNFVFPNPVVQSSSIHFYLQHSEKVKIMMYDSMGKLVSILADEPMSSGENEIEIQRGELPKGIYTCKIVTYNEIVGIKVIMD